MFKEDRNFTEIRKAKKPKPAIEYLQLRRSFNQQKRTEVNVYDNFSASIIVIAIETDVPFSGVSVRHFINNRRAAGSLHSVVNYSLSCLC